MHYNKYHPVIYLMNCSPCVVYDSGGLLISGSRIRCMVIGRFESARMPQIRSSSNDSTMVGCGDSFSMFTIATCGLPTIQALYILYAWDLRE